VTLRAAPILLALAALCFRVFPQVSTHEFVDWDDGVWITENPKLASGLTPGSIWTVLTSPHEGNWIPLFHLSLLVTRTLSGPQPAGFLLGNLVLHTLATVVLFLALARDPELISAANNLAWVLATSRDPALREPAEAVRLAELAVEKQTPPDPGYLDTLAASDAADGRFDDAVRTATSALDLAKERGDGATAKEIRARLDLFRAHRAWVQPARE
jgi:hypothetical protein